MNIKLKVVSENPDGSANAQVTYDKEGLDFLVQEGTTSIIKQYIAQQKGEVKVGDLWDVANEIDSLANSISNIANQVEMIATATQDPESGALWGVHDHLEILSEKLSLKSEKLLEIRKEQAAKDLELSSEVKPKKKKKKEIDMDGRC